LGVDNVGSLTSHDPIDLYRLLREALLLLSIIRVIIALLLLSIIRIIIISIGMMFEAAEKWKLRTTFYSDRERTVPIGRFVNERKEIDGQFIQ
jgi:hypothetical protein